MTLKKFLSFLAVFLLVLSFASCDDEEEDEATSKEKINKVLSNFESYLNSGDFNSFQGLWLDSSNSGQGDLTQTVFDTKKTTHAPADLQSIEITVSGTTATATATNATIGVDYSFKFEKSGDSWYIKEWTDSAGVILDRRDFVQ